MYRMFSLTFENILQVAGLKKIKEMLSNFKKVK